MGARQHLRRRCPAPSRRPSLLAGWHGRRGGRENLVLARVSTSTGPSCSMLRLVGTSPSMPGHAPWTRNGRACTTSPPLKLAASRCAASNLVSATSSSQNAMSPTRPGDSRAGVVPNLAAMPALAWSRPGMEPGRGCRMSPSAFGRPTSAMWTETTVIAVPLGRSRRPAICELSPATGHRRPLHDARRATHVSADVGRSREVAGASRHTSAGCGIPGTVTRTPPASGGSPALPDVGSSPVSWHEGCSAR